MRMSIIFTILVTGYVVSALPVEELRQDEGHSRYFKYIDDDGIEQTVDLEEQPDRELLAEIERNPANNRYWLYTRQNPVEPQELVMDNADSILNSNFNGKVNTVLVAHGWVNNQQQALNPAIRDAYLARNDVNVIILDWRRLASSTYVTASQGIPAVGRGVGNFLAYLNRVAGAQIRNMHLIGFGLGAHLVGYAGRHLGGRPARITALDPAGPLWTSANSGRVGPNDGVYVEAIHTNSGLLGYGIGTAIADVDFFPNGGTSQPGCLTNICDHNRAWAFFASTVINNHLFGRRCANNLQLNFNTCRGEILHMGNDILTKTGSGVYRLDTRRYYPF